MRPSGIDQQYIPQKSPPTHLTPEEERIASLYPPEIVRDRYWNGGEIKNGSQPHCVTATPSHEIQRQDWTIRSLSPILPPYFKKNVIFFLMMRKRPECPLSKLSVDVLLYLLEFTLPVKLFGPPSFDYENGLVLWLGTNKGTSDDFQPPTESIIPTASTIASNSDHIITLIGRNGGSGYTQPIPNSWVQLDLTPSGLSLCVTHYSYGTRRYGGTPRAIRNWEFQASNDGINWVILRKHVEDFSIPDTNDGSATFEVDSKGWFYSRFRIVQTGPNAYRETGRGYWQDNYAQINFGNWELYGCIFQ